MKIRIIFVWPGGTMTTFRLNLPSLAARVFAAVKRLSRIDQDQRSTLGRGDDMGGI